MRRRDWLWAVKAVLCCGLVPACTHTAVAPAALGPLEPSARGGDDRPALASNAAPSPYHPQPVAPRRDEAPPGPPAGRPAEKAVQPARYQEARPRIDLEPEAPAEPLPAAPPRPVATAKPPEPPRTEPARPADEPPLLAALRRFLDKKPAEAVTLLERYDKASQELLLGLLPLAVRLSEGGPKRVGEQEAAVLVRQLDGLQDELRAQAALAIDQICFCRWIEGFGIYDPLPYDHVFSPGELVHLYVEVQNFRCEKPAGEEVFVTLLAGSAEIQDNARKTVWGQQFRRERPDRSKTRRHDYFDHYRFCMPELPPGLYTLWITVKEEATGRTARRSLDFHLTHAPAREARMTD